MRSTLLIACAALLGLPAAAQRGAMPLNDHTRLGQRFTSQVPVASVLVTVPSWSDNEGGLTVSLWDSPARKKLLARRAFVGVRDNQQVEVRPNRALPPGSYYWEVSDRTGVTRIGLYYDPLPADTEDCAYLDGKPDPRSRFLFEVSAGPPPRSPVPVLIATLKSGTQQQKAEACRQLAVSGTAAAVPALARLLGDPALSHMARYALEGLPDPSVDAAFRAALGSLQGRLLVGVVNSVAVRRDPAAVGHLAGLLKSGDPEVAAAAAVALGRIGTPAAAAVLGKALAGSPVRLRPALCEGCLSCADALAAAGRREDAGTLYDHLRSPQAPRAIRIAALRGAIGTRGPGGPALLIRTLGAADADSRAVALWLFQHEMPGRSVTLAVAGALGGLSSGTRLLAIGALAARRDAAALPAMEHWAAEGPAPARLAAIKGLPAFGAAVAPTLVHLLDDSSAELRQAAQDGLAGLPATEVATVAASLLRSPDPAKRVTGIRLVHRLQLPAFGVALGAAVRDPSSEVRLAALKALNDLAGPEHIAALRDVLLGAADAPAADSAEQALTAACARAKDPERVAGQLVPGIAGAPPARQAAVLRVLGSVGGARALSAVREAVNGPAGEARLAALDVLCAWPTEAAAPDLLKLAHDAPNPEERTKCLRGALRLAGSQDLPPDRRVALCKEAAGLVQRNEETWLLLGALGGIGSPEALAMVVPHLDQRATRQEACAAVLQIAEKLVSGPDAPKLIGPLGRVAQLASDPEVVKRARALLERARASH